MRSRERAPDRAGGKVDYTALGGFNTLSHRSASHILQRRWLIYVFADAEIKLFHYRAAGARVGQTRRCFGAKKLPRRKTSVVDFALASG